MNQVVITGNMTTDPQFIEGKDVTSRLTFTLARNANDKAMYFDVVMFGRNAKRTAEKGFKKGDNCTVFGELTMNEWVNKEGNRRTSINIIADLVSF